MEFELQSNGISVIGTTQITTLMKASQLSFVQFNLLDVSKALSNKSGQ